MGINIAFIYLDVPNLGDLVIYETAKYITEDILKKNHIQDYTLVPIDISSYKGRTPHDGRRGVKRLLMGGMKRLAKTAFFSHCLPMAARSLLRAQWRMTDRYKYYARQEKPKLKGADMIIFGGGGLIKFHQQNFHFLLDDITKYAQAKGIPVLLNAQGIEGYSEYDQECQMLKDAINRDCVKYASTRDDFAMLRNCYIDNPNITVRSVCDPAFWVSEAYQIQRDPSAKKVGLNVIRTNIFQEYLYKDVNRQTLGVVYYELIQKLFQEGYQVELFSNGIETDTKFIEWLFKSYPDLEKDYKVTVAAPSTTRELVETIAGYQRFMAVRLHASIIGSVLGIPNVSLVWNRKQPLFGKEIGMPQNFLSKDQFKADIIFQKLCGAKPYQMDEGYKMSVYQNLEEQILSVIQKLVKA